MPKMFKAKTPKIEKKTHGPEAGDVVVVVG